MRRIIISGLALSSLLCGCSVPGKALKETQMQAAASFIPAESGQRDDKDKLTYDFGRIREGVVVEHSFVLRNESKRTLTITGTVTSCGCTASSVRKNTLAAGEETFLDVKFNAKGYSGAVTQFVYVNTDDVDNPAGKFIIKAMVVPQTGE